MLQYEPWSEGFSSSPKSSAAHLLVAAIGDYSYVDGIQLATHSIAVLLAHFPPQQPHFPVRTVRTPRQQLHATSVGQPIDNLKRYTLKVMK